MRQIIVTGAGRGLGRAISQKLAENGFKILALDIEEESLKELKTILKSSIETFQIDIRDENQVERFFGAISSNQLYGLVNNAGIYLGKGLLDYDSAEVNHVLNVNLVGAIYCTKYFAKKMLSRVEVESTLGSIVNISSSSIYGGSDAVYSATKAALIGLTKSCALQFSPYIRVNAVAPGVVETDLLKAIPEKVMDHYRKLELVKDPIRPSDVANTIAFLMEESGKNYSGAVFDLNNGYHL